MKLSLSIDRFEGDKKQIAVLLTDDGTQINFPKALLPKGVEGRATSSRSRSSGTPRRPGRSPRRPVPSRTT